MTPLEVKREIFFISLQSWHYHHQIKPTALHSLMGDVYDIWVSKMDKFIEAYQGSYELINGDIDIKIYQYKNKEDVFVFLKSIALFLESDARTILFGTSDSSLHNILDEVLGDIKKFIFLFNLEIL